MICSSSFPFRPSLCSDLHKKTPIVVAFDNGIYYSRKLSMHWTSIKSCNRSSNDLRKFLRYYNAYHELHPFPEGWTEDLTQVIRTIRGDVNAHPEIVLVKKTV